MGAWWGLCMFSDPKFGCLSLLASVQTCCQILIKHSKRKWEGRHQGNRNRKMVRNSFRSPGAVREQGIRRLCWLMRYEESPNHNRPHLYWHVLTEWTAGVNLLSILFQSLAGMELYLQSRQVWQDLTGWMQKKKWNQLSSATEVLQWAITLVRHSAFMEGTPMGSLLISWYLR